MNTILTELNAWAPSAHEVIFNDELKARLGEYGQLGKENSQHIRSYIFRYESNGKLISGFLVAPKYQPPKPLPVIIFNRGGTKDYGLVKQGALFTRLGWLARTGYVVVGSQYPENSVSEGKDEWGGTDLDSVLILHSLIAHLSLADEKRIGMLGASRGGMMTYLALTKVSWIKAAVTIAGVANLTRIAELRPEMQTVFKHAFGGDSKSKQQRSAVNWTNDFPDTPLLIMHGTADNKVSPLDSLELATELHNHHKPFRLVIFDGAGHGLAEYADDWHHQTTEWFDRFVS